ncbi:DsbA family protein [Piscinibacter sp. XHJ-5]|uniref:DsbA family protein n=1 Tax=Piscinibacter sp. XHJ-5 TaxID=3037797 RepID=UPI00245290FD|nr:DsbA family protein [Piscinibacter sp. XHJ-5]
MHTATLHYIHDPLCGWCYGAAPLVKAARDVVDVRPHGGGLMAGAQRRRVSPQLRAFVMPHDRRIAQLSGQPFGAAYFDGLLRDESAVFDSQPPIAAMLAAQDVAGRGLDMLARLQQAHYVEGRRIAERAVLVELAVDIGLEPGTFEQALAAVEGPAVQAHIAGTRALMNRVGVAGFPGFVLEIDGRMRVLDVGRYLGRPEVLAAELRQRVNPPE